jgi:tetratricopeptide (TPR) repeat protein
MRGLQLGSIGLLLSFLLSAHASESLQQLLNRVAAYPPEQAWQELQASSSAYLNDADYNYALGVYASNSGNFGQAINAFERAVLLRPTHAGAWLDLAIAYKQAGDSITALELLKHIQTNLSPPSHVQALIDRFQRDWQPSESYYQLSYTIGHSSNPSASAKDSSIPLYIAGWTYLPLAENMRPKASAFHTLAFEHGYSHGEQQRWLQVSQRVHLDNQQADQQQISGLWQYVDAQQVRWQLVGNYSHLDYLGRQQQVNFQRWQPAATDWLWGLSYRLRRFQESSFDHNSFGVQIMFAPRKLPVQWTLGVEQENPTGVRPGGSAMRWHSQVYWSQVLHRDKLVLFAQLSYSQDQDPYASLLPITRQLSRSQLGGYWQHPFSQQFAIRAGWQYAQQDANHPLFSWNDSQWTFSLLWQVE